MIGVRDSKNPSGATLVFDANAWESFISRAGKGHFDRP